MNAGSMRQKSGQNLNFLQIFCKYLHPTQRFVHRVTELRVDFTELRVCSSLADLKKISKFLVF